MPGEAWGGLAPTPGGFAGLVLGAPYGEGELGVILRAGVAPVPIEGAVPGEGEFGVEVGAGGAVVPVDGALVGGELGVTEGLVVPVDGALVVGEPGVAVGAVVPVAGAFGAGDLTLGEGTDGVEGSDMPGHLPHVI